MTINDYAGRPCLLSDEIYRLGPNPTPIDVPRYVEGTLVRKIGGVDGVQRPGYHFVRGFVTVCRVDAEIAGFVGVREEALLPVD